MESAETRSRLLSALVLVPALLALQACYEDSSPLPSAEDSPVAAGRDHTDGPWLEPGATITPAAWLSRISGAAQDSLEPLLQLADRRWREDQRMIANRFAGLWRDTQGALPLQSLIGDFLALPPRSEGTLAALIQSYRVLRDEGADHTAALRVLSGETQ